MVKQRSNRAGATPRSRFINRAGLQKAILAQDVAAARVCLDSGVGADTNMPDYACHALGFAAQDGAIEIVRLLIDRGATVNLPCGPNGVGNALLQACQGAQSEVAALLVASGADTTLSNGDTILSNVITTANALNEHLVSGRCPQAANGGRSQRVVHDQRTAIAQLLGLTSDSLKADVEKAISPLSVSEALYEAALAGWLWLLEQMLKHGADVAYSRPNGAHPLYIACKEGHESCARALVAAGADPNQVKAGGWTPLLLAVQDSHVGCVRVLIEARADLDHCIDPQPAGNSTCAVMHAVVAPVHAEGGGGAAADEKGHQALALEMRRVRLSAFFDSVSVVGPRAPPRGEGQPRHSLRGERPHGAVQRVLHRPGEVRAAPRVLWRPAPHGSQSPGGVGHAQTPSLPPDLTTYPSHHLLSTTRHVVHVPPTDAVRWRTRDDRGRPTRLCGRCHARLHARHV